MKNEREQTGILRRLMPCLVASLIFLFAADANLHAAVPQLSQDTLSMAGTSSTFGVSGTPAELDGLSFTWFSIHSLIKLIMVSSISLVGLNVASKGKKGWGWFVLGLLLTVVLFIGKGILSMFVEVTTNSSIADWDED